MRSVFTSAGGESVGTDRPLTHLILGNAEVTISKNHCGDSFNKCLVSMCGGIFSSPRM